MVEELGCKESLRLVSHSELIEYLYLPRATNRYPHSNHAATKSLTQSQRERNGEYWLTVGTYFENYALRKTLPHSVMHHRSRTRGLTTLRYVVVPDQRGVLADITDTRTVANSERRDLLSTAEMGTEVLHSRAESAVVPRAFSGVM